MAAFPTDQFERRHVHVVLPGKMKRKRRGDVVAKIWIEKEGERCIEIDWSKLNASDEQMVLRVINENIDTIENQLSKIFSGEKVRILNLSNMCKYKDTTLGIKKLDFMEKRGRMAVYLTDGREVIVPVSAFPDIQSLSLKKRDDWMILDDQFFTFDSMSKIYSIKDVLSAYPM